MGDPALFRSLSDENLVQQYPEKLADIHSYAKAEIIEFLAPNMNTDGEVDVRRDLLSTLREKLCETYCVLFPEYGTRELYDRRRLHTYANDIYYFGNSIRNSDIDKGMKSVFKPSTTQLLQNDDKDDATPDVSMIEQSDVIETCLLLRESVVSLKTIISDLDKKVTGLQTNIGELQTKLSNQSITSINPDATADVAVTDENGPTPKPEGHDDEPIPTQAHHDNGTIPTQASHDNGAIPTQAGHDNGAIPTQAGHDNGPIPTQAGQHQPTETQQPGVIIEGND